MLYTKIQSQNFLSSGEEDFKCFTIYGHGATLFSGVEPFEQIANTPSKERSM